MNSDVNTVINISAAKKASAFAKHHNLKPINIINVY